MTKPRQADLIRAIDRRVRIAAPGARGEQGVAESHHAGHSTFQKGSSLLQSIQADASRPVIFIMICDTTERICRFTTKVFLPPVSWPSAV